MELYYQWNILFSIQHKRSTVFIQVKIYQNELMVEIYSKSLLRAIGKVLLMKFSTN